jgi:hypothetical protein
MAFENITPQVEEAVKASGVREGIALINSTLLADPQEETGTSGQANRQ